MYRGKLHTRSKYVLVHSRARIATNVNAHTIPAHTATTWPWVCTTSIHHSISFPILYDLCLSRLAELVEGRLLLKGSLSYSPYYVTKRGAGSI